MTERAVPVARVAHVEVPPTARYYTLGDAATARELWVVLHGYGQLAGYFVRHFAPLADGRLVVAPEALNRFYLESRAEEGPNGAPPHGRRVGATWMTREDRAAEIADYVRALDAVVAAAADGIDLARVPLVVLGFSQGATTAARWLDARARAGARPAARFVMWQGEWPNDRDLAAAAWLRETRLTIVSSPDDPFATPARVATLLETLDAHGIAHDRLTFDGGHRMDAATLALSARGTS
jgi:predicted esterase